MKVKILALHLGYGGVETYILTLAEILSKEYDVEIIATYKMKNEVEYDSDNIKVTHLISTSPSHHLISEHFKQKKYISSLYFLLKNMYILFLKHIKNFLWIISQVKEGEVIITTRLFHNKLVNNLINNKVYKIATEHNDYPSDSGYVRKIIKSVDKFDYLLPISLEMSNMYKEQMIQSNCKVRFIPYFIDIGFSADEVIEQVKNKNNIVSFVGRMSREKGFDKAIDVYEHLYSIDSSYEFHVYGNKEGLNAALLENHPNIHHHGFLSKDDLVLELLKSNIVLITSERESFGIAALEAIACGNIPIVLSSATGVVNNLLPKFDMLVVDTICDMKHKLTEILELDAVTLFELRVSLIEHGHHYSKERTEKQLLRFFNDLKKE